MRKRTPRKRRPATILFPGAFAAIGLALVLTPALSPAVAAPDRGKHRYEKRDHRGQREHRRHDDHHRYRDDRGHKHHRDSYRDWKHHRDHRFRHGHWKKSRHYYQRPYASHTRYQRHGHYARYDRFVVPKRIVHRHYEYERYFHGRVYHSGHRHHHHVYRFPVYTDHGWRDRLHYYCGDDLYTTGSFVIHGDRFSFGFSW